MNQEKYECALKLMIEELSYPSRELRLSALFDDCRDELDLVLKWLARECERELELQQLFGDAFSNLQDGGETELLPP